MKRTCSLFLLFLLALLPCGLLAQPAQSEADTVLPWNYFRPLDTLHTYQSIIGSPGTAFITGSDSADANDTTFRLPLPFPLFFFGATYPAGYNMRVGVGGFIGLDSITQRGREPYVLMPDTKFNHLIIPFWSDLKTRRGTGEGIYYRLDVDSSGGTRDSVLTVEWYVETMSPPASSGRFQARLAQRSCVTRTGSSHNATGIEFAYDPQHVIDRSSPPGWYGAVIGLKNIGQPIGSPPKTPPADSSYQLLITSTRSAPPYLPCLTRLPTRHHTGTPSLDSVPDWYANYVSTPPTYFHYAFPDSGSKIKPVDADMVIMVGHGRYIGPSNPISLPVKVTNIGRQVQHNVPCQISFTSGGSLISTVRDTILAVYPGDTASIQVTPPTSSSGGYVVVAIVSASVDQNRANDTASISYWVNPSHDAMPMEILSPMLIDVQSPARYVTSTPIPISGVIANSGTVGSAIVAGYDIRNNIGALVAHRSDSLGSGIMPDSVTTHSFGTFIPTQPGLYYIDLFASAIPDQTSSNDTIHSIPYRDWSTHGLTPGARGVRPIPFEVFYPVDLAVGDPGWYPHAPHAEDTIHEATRVLAMILNNGGLDAGNVEVHARIVDTNGTAVYDRTDTITSIASGRGMELHRFADFTPPCSGRYCVKVWVAWDPADSVHANDTASWCFQADVSSTCDEGKLSYIGSPGAGSASAQDGAIGQTEARLRPAPSPVQHLCGPKRPVRDGGDATLDVHHAGTARTTRSRRSSDTLSVLLSTKGAHMTRLGSNRSTETPGPSLPATFF